MTAKELMIGDWVLIKPEMKPIKVATVHQKKIGYHVRADKLNWVRFGLLEPIPLTMEILQHNNFKFIDGGWNQWWHYDPNDVGSDLQLVQIGTGFAIHCRIDMETDYVHELQHAFRMIKRDKTADNIKLI
jgi:hypothetical protein